MNAKTKRVFTIVGILSLTLIFSFVMSNQSNAERLTPPDSIVGMNNMFKEIAEKVLPSIVFIKTTRTVASNIPPAFRDFFRFRERNQERRVQGVGSGVIIEKGYIVTNYHVIKDATGLSILLTNNREYKVTVVGFDAETDVAVLKMIGDTSKVKAASLGDSDKLKTGEIVFALGNPFGLRGSITQGIISATSRQAEEEYGYDFIQTDAAINPGNSGGALVNIYGEVIGINRMIYTQTGGYMGVGFAIPINRVKDVVSMIITQGRVTRGYLGIVPANPDDETSRRLNISTGVRVGDVMPGSPAEKAGLKPWDIILKFNNKDIPNFATLRREVALTQPGKTVPIIIKRGNEVKTLQITLVNRDQALAGGPQRNGSQQGGAQSSSELSGMMVRNLTDNERNEASIPHGVVVTKVKPNSPASNAGIMAGDIILEIEGIAMTSVEKIVKINETIKSNATFQMRIKRNGQIRFIIIER